MTKLKLFAVAALAAVIVGVAGLVAAPSASAKPRMSCAQAIQLSRVYIANGNVMLGIGSPAAASAWFGRAQGILDGAC
jgi:hypothetical protein